MQEMMIKMTKCLPVYTLRHVCCTINFQLHRPRLGGGEVSSGAGIVPSVFVGDAANDEHTSSGTNRGGGNAQVRSDVTAVEEPRYGEGLVSLTDNARHLGKLSLVHYISSEGQRKQFWGL